MSINTKAFSVKKNVEPNRIYHAFKFPQAKRNLEQHEAQKQLPNPTNYKHENNKCSKKSPEFSDGKDKKCLFRGYKKVQNPFKQKTENPKINTETNYEMPTSSRNNTESTKDMMVVPSKTLEKKSVKVEKLVNFSQEKKYEKITDIFETPGPFEYHVEQNKNLTQYGKFGREKRMSLKLSEIPGVGQYSIEASQHSPHTIFPAERGREKLFQAAYGPGPTSYTSCLVEKYKSHARSTSISFCRERRSFEVQETLSPGPGDYDIEEKKSNSPSPMKGTFNFKETNKWHQTSFFKPNLNLADNKSRTARFRKKKLNKSPNKEKNSLERKKASIEFI